MRFSGVPTREELEAYLARRLACLRRGERHGIVYDTRQVRLIPPELRARHTEWTREHEALRRQGMLGNALVITSPVIRLTISLAVHLRWEGVPYCVTATVPEAALWMAQRLEDEGQTEPAGRIRRHFGNAS